MTLSSCLHGPHLILQNRQARMEVGECYFRICLCDFQLSCLVSYNDLDVPRSLQERSMVLEIRSSRGSSLCLRGNEVQFHLFFTIYMLSYDISFSPTTFCCYPCVTSGSQNEVCTENVLVP